MAFPSGKGSMVKTTPAKQKMQQMRAPGPGKSPGRGNGNQFQYSCQENPKDRGAWLATVHRVQRVRGD